MSGEARKGLSNLPEKQLNLFLQIAVEYLMQNPLLRIPGKVKKLKGAYERRRMMQYDIDRQYRIHYWVDPDSSTVHVDYVGHHP